MNLLALLLICTNPVELTVSEHVDSIERNALHCDQTGRHVFDQLIFRDWYWQCEYSHVTAWRLVKEGSPAVCRVWPSGEYECLWLDGEVLRRVRARTFHETLTLSDPEVAERDVLPKCERRELRVRE